MHISDTMEKKIVPIDLFPVNPSLLTETWAFQTYHYFKAFNRECVNDIPTLEDARKWIQVAKDITEDLKGIGVSKSQEKICDMMNTYFTFDRKNATFCSFYDVIGFLSDTDFYQKNKDLCRNMIHMFQYGIFRVGNNAWALQAAHDWMEKRNLTFEDKSRGIRRKGKDLCINLLLVAPLTPFVIVCKESLSRLTRNVYWFATRRRTNLEIRDMNLYPMYLIIDFLDTCVN